MKLGLTGKGMDFVPYTKNAIYKRRGMTKICTYNKEFVSISELAFIASGNPLGAEISEFITVIDLLGLLNEIESCSIEVKDTVSDQKRLQSWFSTVSERKTFKIQQAAN